jgi:hypothetical protein
MMQLEAQTPTQKLFLSMVLARGGEAVPVELAEADVAEWKRRFGEPTKRKVDAWVDTCPVVRAGLDLMISRPVAAE